MVEAEAMGNGSLFYWKSLSSSFVGFAFGSRKRREKGKGVIETILAASESGDCDIGG